MSLVASLLITLFLSSLGIILARKYSQPLALGAFVGAIISLTAIFAGPSVWDLLEASYVHDPKPVSLITIVVFSVLGGVLATRFKQPSVLGVLIAGALVGPNALGLLSDKNLMNGAIELGAILLLFLVGIEFSLEKLLDMGLRSVIIATIKITIVFFSGYHIALLFGLSHLAGIAIGVMLSMTSTVIFLKILEQKGLLGRPEVPILIAVLIIEDIFGVFALTFFSGLASQERITAFIILFRLAIALAILGLAYLLLRRWLRPAIDWLSRYSTQDTITFIAIGLCAVMSYMAHLLNLSTAVGAFLAGNIVASLKNANEFEHAMHPFILTFTSLFFFSIGTVISFKEVFSNFWLIIVLFVVSVLFKFLAIGISTYLFSVPSGRSAVFSGIAMLSLGEFSLLISREANSLAPGIDLVSITAAIIFLSSLAMSLCVTHTAGLYRITSYILPRGIKFDLSEASRYCRTLSSEAILNKLSNRRISLQWKSIAKSLGGIMLTIIISLILYNSTQFRNVELLHRDIPVWTIFAFIAIILVFPTFSIIRNIRDLLWEIAGSFLKHYPNQVSNPQKIVRNIVFVVLLFLFSFLIPFIISVFNLHPIFAIPMIPMIMLLVFVVMKVGGGLIEFLGGNRKFATLYLKASEAFKRKKTMSKLKIQSMIRQREIRKMLK
ncbi:MAG TPA: cation:proton antiporter [Candidatus Nanoarchaeia archaeon]|nr:cation:proton antiporter [Candidatus Nanoarchaeia archaeon]